jgi:hypothetical protein
MIIINSEYMTIQIMTVLAISTNYPDSNLERQVYLRIKHCITLSYIIYTLSHA